MVVLLVCWSVCVYALLVVVVVFVVDVAASFVAVWCSVCVAIGFGGPAVVIGNAVVVLFLSRCCETYECGVTHVGPP